VELKSRPHSLVPVSESNGLICAFRLGTGSPCEREVLAGDENAEGLWLHFDLVDSRARAWLERSSNIPDLALELFLDPHPRARMQAVDGGVTLVLDDLYHDFRDDPDAFDTVRVFIDDNRIVTGRFRPLKTLDGIRRDLSDRLLDVSTAAGLFRVLVERLGITFGEIVTKVADAVDDMEDDVLAGKTRDRAARLGHVRRILARLRRHLNSNRVALRGFPHERLKTWSKDERSELKQSADHLDDLAQEMELVQERARLVQEEIAGKLNEATNRNLYFISVATALMLPTTLVTGIWGMNVGGLPWAEDSNGFIMVGVLMMGVVGLALALLRVVRFV